MDRHEFKVTVESLEIYFDPSRPIKDDTVNAWFKEIQHIDTKPMEWIVSKLKRRYDSFPKNLPLRIIEIYGEWLEKSPDPEAKKQNCQECQGAGYLFVKTTRNGLPYSYLFRCGVCRQIQNAKLIPFATLSELASHDYAEYLPRNKEKILSQAQKEKIHQLTGLMGGAKTESNGPKPIRSLFGRKYE